MARLTFDSLSAELNQCNILLEKANKGGYFVVIGDNRHRCSTLATVKELTDEYTTEENTSSNEVIKKDLPQQGEPTEMEIYETTVERINQLFNYANKRGFKNRSIHETSEYVNEEELGASLVFIADERKRREVSKKNTSSVEVFEGEFPNEDIPVYGWSVIEPTLKLQLMHATMTIDELMVLTGEEVMTKVETTEDNDDLIYETLAILTSEDLEPTVYLTGNTPVTATEMMMSQLPSDICTPEIARELLDFALLLRTDGYTPEQGSEVYQHLENDFLLTTNEVHKYTNIAISVRAFMDAHDGGHYSTLSTHEYDDDWAFNEKGITC